MDRSRVPFTVRLAERRRQHPLAVSPVRRCGRRRRDTRLSPYDFYTHRKFEVMRW